MPPAVLCCDSWCCSGNSRSRRCHYHQFGRRSRVARESTPNLKASRSNTTKPSRTSAITMSSIGASLLSGERSVREQGQLGLPSKLVDLRRMAPEPSELGIRRRDCFRDIDCLLGGTHRLNAKRNSQSSSSNCEGHRTSPRRVSPLITVSLFVPSPCEGGRAGIPSVPYALWRSQIRRTTTLDVRSEPPVRRVQSATLMRDR